MYGVAPPDPVDSGALAFRPTNTGNPDLDSLNALHNAAIRVALARQANDAAAEAAARQALDGVAAARGGMTDAQLEAGIAQAEAGADPFGLATVGAGLGAVAAVGALLGLGLLVSRFAGSGKGRRRDW